MLNIPFTFKAAFVACFFLSGLEYVIVHYLCAVNLNLIFSSCFIKIYLTVFDFMIENLYRQVLQHLFTKCNSA